MAMDFNDNLVEKVLRVLQGQSQARAIQTIGRCSKIVEAFCQPGSSKIFDISISPEANKSNVVPMPPIIPEKEEELIF